MKKEKATKKKRGIEKERAERGARGERKERKMKRMGWIVVVLVVLVLVGIKKRRDRIKELRSAYVFGYPLVLMELSRLFMLDTNPLMKKNEFFYGRTFTDP